MIENCTEVLRISSQVDWGETSPTWDRSDKTERVCCISVQKSTQSYKGDKETRGMFPIKEQHSSLEAEPSKMKIHDSHDRISKE